MYDMYVEIGLPMTDCEVVSKSAEIRLSDSLVRCNNFISAASLTLVVIAASLTVVNDESHTLYI